MSLRRTWLAIGLFCGMPLIVLIALVVFAFMAGTAILNSAIGPLPLVWVVVPAVSLAAVSVFLAHFEDAVNDFAAWIAILLGMALTVTFFAALHKSMGIICTAPVCPGSIAVAAADAGLHTPLGRPANPLTAIETAADQPRPSTVDIDQRFGAALYFSTVTFTTLGYGDFQPLPRLRVLAGFQALLGYLFLGLFVGSAIDYLGQKSQPARSDADNAEATRQAAEADRTAAEADRHKAEHDRQATEAARQSAEVAREQAEMRRQAAEDHRDTPTPKS